MNKITNTILHLWSTGRKTKSTTGGWISGNAPCCVHRGESADKRQRGGIKVENDGWIYSCFNCGFKAGWRPGNPFTKNTKNFLKWMGVPESEITKLVLEVLHQKTNGNDDVIKSLNFTLEERSLPEDSYSISMLLNQGLDDENFLACCEYIANRGLSLNDYNWHWSAADGYQDRVLIPFYQDGKIVGYTGRKIIEGKPKYLSNSQNGYVFNIDAQTYDKQFLIVVEGQFDAIAIEGCAIMTNEPNDIQIARINSKNKEVIVVPDRDRAGAKLINAAIENNWSISIPPWEDKIKDVADAVKEYGKLYTLATILHYKERGKIKLELQKKKLEKYK